jgi:hypothetical protein
MNMKMIYQAIIEFTFPEIHGKVVDLLNVITIPISFRVYCG